MTAKKFIIPFVLASLAGHALVLALTTRIEWTTVALQETSEPEEKVITVELKAPPKNSPITTARYRRERPTLMSSGVTREDSAALRGEQKPYGDYLLLIRRKIEQLWHYPPQALAELGEGDAVIRFTIDANGTLSGYYVMATSGSPVLDEGALAVVKAAAPYEPIPAEFNLSRLHITATFSYRMEH